MPRPLSAEPDPITARAMASVIERLPHERLLLATGWSLRELAKRMGVDAALLHKTLNTASQTGRLSAVWANRLSDACQVTATELTVLFARADGPAPIETGVDVAGGSRLA